jgi:hypothetical protein
MRHAARRNQIFSAPAPEDVLQRYRCHGYCTAEIPERRGGMSCASRVAPTFSVAAHSRRQQRYADYSATVTEEFRLCIFCNHRGARPGTFSTAVPARLVSQDRNLNFSITILGKIRWDRRYDFLIAGERRCY